MGTIRRKSDQECSMATTKARTAGASARNFEQLADAINVCKLVELTIRAGHIV